MEILITFFLGIFIIAGACVARCVRNTKIIEQLSISAAFGTMLALSIMELFPEAFEQLGKDNVWVIITFIALGVLLLKLLDHFIPKHHHSHGADRRYTAENVIHIGIISSIAVILHNVIEGMAVYSIAAESLSSGVMMAIAVGLHNIPMGMVIYSTLRQEKNYQDGSHLRSCFIHVCGRSDNGLALVHNNAFRNRYPHESDSRG